MKKVLVLLDGATEGPIPALGNKTPLEAANLTTLHKLAKQGTVGWTKTILEGLPVQPEAAALEILGYDSLLFYSGRGAFRALGANVALTAHDVAFTCAILSTDGEQITQTRVELVSEDARELLSWLQQKLGERSWRFVPMKSERHLLVWNNGSSRLHCEPPDDLKGKRLKDCLPQGERDQTIRQLIYDAIELLEKHQINRKRRYEGEPVANLIWPYEAGLSPNLPSFRLLAGMVRAEAVTDHTPMCGLCRAIGIRVYNPPTISLDELTDGYFRLTRFVSDLITDTDFLMVHLRETDYASHRCDPEQKVFVLQRFGEVFLPQFLDALTKHGEFRFVLICSHRCSSVTGRHERGEVPFLFLPRIQPSKVDEFHEPSAMEKGVKLDRASHLAQWLLDLKAPVSMRQRS